MITYLFFQRENRGNISNSVSRKTTLKFYNSIYSTSKNDSNKFQYCETALQQQSTQLEAKLQ